uniref:DUF5658 domain-containing protein n=1 Tax=viral metagenome TaxID=1070528 RepID=A0A6M3IZJ5_9ZZZZ
MKRLACVALLLALPLYLAAENKPSKAFTLAQAAMSGSIIFDTAYTYDAIWNYNCHEGNPLFSGLMDKPYLVMAIDLGICTGLSWAAGRLYRKDKRLGWALVIGVYVVQGYMLYLHLRARQ